MELQNVIDKLNNFKKALARLELVLLKEPVDEFISDAIIKRFEFTYELAWKVMKIFLEYQGRESLRYPRDIFKEAFSTGLIQDGNVWLDMLGDRNLMSHTYDEAGSAEICDRIRTVYFNQFKLLVATLEKETNPLL